MSENKFQVIYNGKVEKETIVPVQEIDREIKDQKKGANIVKVNEEGTALMQVKHEFINVGERIAQVKHSTSAQVTKYGTIKVVQFKQQISSRGEDVFYFSNDTGTFEGTLEDAIKAFPDVSFNELNIPELQYQDDLELGRIPILPNTVKEVEWTNHNYYDSEEKGGKPTNWKNWVDNTQLALDAIGLIPGIGEFADCANGLISLARGNYADAALSFVGMIPFLGNAATAAKISQKAKAFKKVIKGEEAKAVYDLIVKNGDDIQGYVGQSGNVYQRFIQHFNPKRGKLFRNVIDKGSIIHKMPGSTKLEREMYEQFIILEKYGGDLTKRGSNELHKLLNKVNPVGGRYNLTNPKSLNEFREKAIKIAKKHNLPTTFNPLTF